LSPPSDLPPPRPREFGNGYRLWQTDTDREAITLAVSGEIDLSNAEQFEEELHRIVNGTDRQLVLDLQDCSFIDSTAIRMLVKVAHEQREHGRALGLSRIGHEPKRYLEIAGLLDSDLFLNYPEPPPSRE
jgi:anti-sigma B factor antagonist